jgi:hypothetical protein
MDLLARVSYLVNCSSVANWGAPAAAISPDDQALQIKERHASLTGGSILNENVVTRASVQPIESGAAQ